MRAPRVVVEKELAKFELEVNLAKQENDELNQKLMELLTLSEEFGAAARHTQGRNVAEYIKKKFGEIEFEIQSIRSRMADNVEKINQMQPEIQNFTYALRAIDSVRV